MARIHPVFHVVKLMPVPPDLIKGRHAKPPPPPKIIGGEERYEVDEVLDSRMKGRKLQYLVRWRGYGHKENSWIPEEDLDAAKLIANFYRAHPNAPKWINVLILDRWDSDHDTCIDRTLRIGTLHLKGGVM